MVHSRPVLYRTSDATFFPFTKGLHGIDVEVAGILARDSLLKW